MARRALSPTCLALVQCLEREVPPALAATGLSSCRIGLSGGADSLALTAAMAWARDHRRGPLAEVAVSVRVVDHGLQVGSAGVADRAAQQARDLGLEVDIVRVTVAVDGSGIEAAARTARYSALSYGDPALVLLAHTLDDQAETVLLGLARGSGTRSLAGMPTRRDQILRPFLSVRRTDTERACRDWGLTWWNDPTNEDPAFTRSRLRAAMPLLEETLGPGFAEGLARTADLARQDADFLDDQAAQVGLDITQPALPLAELQSLPVVVRQRLLLAWLRQVGTDAVSREHVLAVDSLLMDWHGQKSITVPSAQVTRTPTHLQQTSSDKVSHGDSPPDSWGQSP